MQVVYALPVPSIYVFLLLLAGLSFMYFGGGFKTNYACLLFLLFAIISIIGNDIPVFFKPWQRFALFTLLMIGGSPWFSNPQLNRFRRQVFMGSLWAMGGIMVWSMVAYVTGTGQYIWGIVNGYMGVASHPNFLGFYLMVVMSWLAALFFRCTVMKERVIVALLWSCCVVLLLLSASRSATACGALGTLLAVYLRFQKSAGKLLTSLMVLVGVVILSLPALLPYMEAMSKKKTDFEDKEAMVLATRGGVWEVRLAEIEKSPIIGVGAYSCDTSLPLAKIYYSETTGTVELGSSYLGVLSQTGWLGFLAFMAVLTMVFWKAWKYATRERTPFAQLMVVLLLPIFGNMIFEGYAMTGGAVQCVVLWLLLGVADQCDTVADYPVMWEKEDPITPSEYVAWRNANRPEM